MDRASRVLTRGVPAGVPRSYRALADHCDVSHSTLHHRARGRPSIEEKARGQQYLYPYEEDVVVKYLLQMSDLGHPVRIPSVRHPSRSPDEGFGRNQVVVYKERVKEGVVRFIEKGAILGEVPFREEDVNSQAKEYADQGKKLFLEQGPYFIWHDCYEILKRTKRSAVTVTTVAESWVGKRRRGEDLPEQLQPATKEAFDFPIDEDEDEDEEL